MFLIRGKCKNHTLYSPIIGSVNYVTDVHELAPIFSLHSSKCSFFCKEKAVVLILSNSGIKKMAGLPEIISLGFASNFILPEGKEIFFS